MLNGSSTPFSYKTFPVTASCWNGEHQYSLWKLGYIALALSAAFPMRHIIPRQSWQIYHMAQRPVSITSTKFLTAQRIIGEQYVDTNQMNSHADKTHQDISAKSLKWAEVRTIYQLKPYIDHSYHHVIKEVEGMSVAAYLKVNLAMPTWVRLSNSASKLTARSQGWVSSWLHGSNIDRWRYPG